jgi:hypothetical protein
MVIKSFAKGTPLTLSGSCARIFMSADEPAPIRHCHEEKCPLKPQKCLVIPVRDTRKTRADTAKASTAAAPRIRLAGCNSARTSHRQRQPAAKSRTFVTCIRSFVTLWQKLLACFSEHTFDQRNRVLVSRVVTHPDVRDRVSVKIDRFRQVPNRLIQCSTRPSELVCLSQARLGNVACSKVAGQLPVSSNKGGSSEL